MRKVLMKVRVKFDRCVVHGSGCDWERANAFYKTMLGAEVVEMAPDHYACRSGDCRENA